MYLSSLFLPTYSLLCHFFMAFLSTPPAPLPPPSPPSLSFWWFGNSELVAVCIAKGNVSSAQKKWVRTLERSLHMLSDTQCWGCMHEVNQITVSSVSCTWMFPLLTPVVSHPLLRLHSCSHLGSLLLQSRRSSLDIEEIYEKRTVY